MADTICLVDADTIRLLDADTIYLTCPDTPEPEPIPEVAVAGRPARRLNRELMRREEEDLILVLM